MDIQESPRKGFLYRSPHKGFIQNVHKGTPERHPVTGDIIGWRIPRLVADFGSMGGEQTIVNPETGGHVQVADIRGGFFDSMEAQERLGWTDEWREMVERKLDEVAQSRPDYVQKVVAVHVPAPIPWVTYNELSADDVVDLAPKLNLVAESLRYERENQNREEVVVMLETVLESAGLPDPEPLSEIPAEQLQQMPPQGVTLQAPPKSTDSGIPLDTEGFLPRITV